MSIDPTGDFFGTNMEARTEMSEDAAQDSLRRAKHAILQKPISHLDVRRGAFSVDNINLFEDINPVQVAQQFLSIICDTMLMGDGIEHAEAERRLADFVEQLDITDRLNDRQRLKAAQIVIDAVRNKQNDYAKYQEFVTHPITGVREEFMFELVVSERRDDRSGDANVYRLTENGTKLLLVMLSSPDEIDMMSLLIQNSISRGEFGKALGQLRRQHSHIIQIWGRLKDIRRELQRSQYDMSFDAELRGLIDRSKTEVEGFEHDRGLYWNATSKARDNGVTDREALAIAELEDMLANMREGYSRLNMEISSVSRAYTDQYERRIAGAGVSTRAPDLIESLLKPLVCHPMDSVISLNVSAGIAAVFTGTRPTAIFDPFVLFDQGRTRTDEDDFEDDDVGEVVMIVDDNYKIREMAAFHDEIERAVLSRPQGYSLLELSSLVEADGRLTDRQRAGILHYAAVFQADDRQGPQVVKSLTGLKVDNRFLIGQDVRIRIEEARHGAQ